MAALGVVLTELYLLLFWLRSFRVAIIRLVAAGNVRCIHAFISVIKIVFKVICCSCTPYLDVKFLFCPAFCVYCSWMSGRKVNLFPSMIFQLLILPLEFITCSWSTHLLIIISAHDSCALKVLCDKEIYIRDYAVTWKLSYRKS